MDLTVVDSFTDRPFAGNPAAVAVRGRLSRRGPHAGHRPRDEPVGDGLRRAARPTARTTCGGSRPRSRWTCAATPPWPRPTCSAGTGTFHTRSGELVCTPADDGWIEMDFPADPHHLGRRAPAGLAAALGLDDRVGACAPSPDGTRRCPGRAGRRRRTVRALRPDQAGVAALGSRCVIVTAAGDRAGRRLCQSGVRAQRRHPRGSRHRLGPLHVGGVLGRTPRARRARGGTGLGARRRGAHAARRGSRSARRSGRHGVTGPACVV